MQIETTAEHQHMQYPAPILQIFARISGSFPRLEIGETKTEDFFRRERRRRVNAVRNDSFCTAECER